MNSVGGSGWGEADISWSRVDADERLVIVLMIQLTPSETEIREKFPTLVYQALDGAPRTGSH
jgi:hypothetical protein